MKERQIEPSPFASRQLADPTRWFSEIFKSPYAWVGIVVWISSSIAIPFLAGGSVPLHQPWLASEPYRVRIAWLIANPVFALMIIPVVYALTHHREVNVAARAPERRIAACETAVVLIYGGVVLVLGQIAGRALGFHGIGLHLTGSMFGLDEAVMRREVYFWSFYNSLFYAAVPYLSFRRRGYSNEALCLKSSDIRNDVLVIFYVLAIGLAGDLPGSGIWRLSVHQLLIGGSLSFLFSFFGTRLPIMIFLTSILVPRYKQLTGSTAATVILGGFTYASLHLAEYWTRYDSPAHAALSVICIVLTFGPPGMVKSYLTQRTGNAWVHLWGFHIIWPHVSDDTATFVRIFGIR